MGSEVLKAEIVLDDTQWVEIRRSGLVDIPVSPADVRMYNTMSIDCPKLVRQLLLGLSPLFECELELCDAVGRREGHGLEEAREKLHRLEAFGIICDISELCCRNC